MRDELSGFHIDKPDENTENGIKRVELTKSAFIFFAEVMRYISSTGIHDMNSRIDRSLEQKDDVYDLDSRQGLAVYSTWQLCSDLQGKRYVGTNASFEIQPAGGKLNFSAHAHPYEPLTASPDDLYIASMMKGEKANYIVDRFMCVEY